MDKKIIDDYYTTEQIPIGFELTDTLDDEIFHKHDFFEIFYIISGRAKHIVEDDNGNIKTFIVEEGDIFFLGKGIYHGFNRSKGEYCLHRDLVIRYDFFKEVCKSISPELYDELNRDNFYCSSKISLESIQYFEQQIRLIQSMNIKAFDKKRIMMRILLTSTLSSFIEGKETEDGKNIPKWLVSLVNNFDKIEFMRGGLPYITSFSSNYNNKYVCHVFKKYMGLTMTEYLNEVRLKYSLNLLKYTDKNIYDIAQYVGFSSISYFNIIFKKKYGVTPNEFRKKRE